MSSRNAERLGPDAPLSQDLCAKQPYLPARAPAGNKGEHILEQTPSPSETSHVDMGGQPYVGQQLLFKGLS